MNARTFYIPMNSSSLAHYFGRGIILPSRYYSNKPSDIQNGYSDAILLSTKKWVNGSDCSLEVILTDEENSQIQNDAITVSYFNGIPVSRVKSIYFKSEEQRQTTIWNIVNGTAFVPESLIKVEPSTTADSYIPNPILPNSNISHKNDLTEKVKRFDILMGGLAFMRIGKPKYQPLPKDYISTVSYFNHYIKEQVSEPVKRNSSSDDSLTGVFILKPGSEWSNFQALMFENVTNEMVVEFGHNHRIPVEVKHGVINLSSIPENSLVFLLAVLATYGTNKPKNIEELVLFLENGKLTDRKTEEIALIFGLNTGYSNLRNKYNRNNPSPVKFKLESSLDYYIIESIFQFVFSSRRENKYFEYLDNWIPGKYNEQPIHYIRTETSVQYTKKEPQESAHIRKTKSLSDITNETIDAIVLNKLASLEKAVKEELADCRKSLEQQRKEIEDLRNQISNLEKEFSKSIRTKSPSNFSEKPAITNNNNVSQSLDNYESMEFKDLKALAKGKNIPTKSLTAIKNTQKGKKDLIALIKNNQTLL